MLSCANKAFCFVNLAGIRNLNHERKREKDSGRSSINEAIMQNGLLYTKRKLPYF